MGVSTSLVFHGFLADKNCPFNIFLIRISKKIKGGKGTKHMTKINISPLRPIRYRDWCTKSQVIKLTYRHEGAYLDTNKTHSRIKLIFFFGRLINRYPETHTHIKIHMQIQKGKRRDVHCYGLYKKHTLDYVAQGLTVRRETDSDCRLEITVTTGKEEMKRTRMQKEGETKFTQGHKLYPRHPPSYM